MRHHLMSINSMSKQNTPWTRPSFWYQDKDDQGSISPICTGISGLKWQRTHCDGCSFNFRMVRNHIAEEHFIRKFILSVSNSHESWERQRTDLKSNAKYGDMFHPHASML